MIVAIDFDDTITLAPDHWLSIIKMMTSMDWIVYIVTFRQPSCDPHELEWLRPFVHDIHFTGQTAKEAFMARKKIVVDVWIDDSPVTITHNLSNRWQWEPNCNLLCGCKE